MTTMVKSYDRLSLHEGMALDLPYREGNGVLTRDVARPVRHAATLVGAPVWTQTPLANLTVLDFDGAGDYLECDAADTADLDFTTGDYSLAVWVNWTAGAISQIVLGRYAIDVDGWETYLTKIGAAESLTQRHHHASLAPDRTGCYSLGWVPGQWWLLGITRSGAYPLHYRNGVPLTMTYDVGGLLDPDSCNRDLVIGCRFSKDTNWYKGQMWRPRIWSRSLSAFEMSMLFEMERSFFGV